MRQESLRGQVVVITGASSGNGLAGALAFARAGARLVLAARGVDGLEGAAAQCRRAGAEDVLVAPTDTTDLPAMRALADEAVARFGRIDVWVNNAAVMDFARIEETPPEEFRRVMDTNFFGYLHGVWAVMPHFRRQGRGTLINTLSLLSKVTFPYYGAYAAAKHAAYAMLETLREEVRDTDVHVCMVLPATIDTPLYQHAGNHAGHALRVPPPIYDPRLVGEAMVSLARHPRREVMVGRVGHALTTMRTLAPNAYDAGVGAAVPRVHFRDEAAAETSGNLFEPTARDLRVDGGWRRREHLGAAKAALYAGVALGALAALAWGWRATAPPTQRP